MDGWHQHIDGIDTNTYIRAPPLQLGLGFISQRQTYSMSQQQPCKAPTKTLRYNRLHSTHRFTTTCGTSYLPNDCFEHWSQLQTLLPSMLSTETVNTTHKVPIRRSNYGDSVYSMSTRQSPSSHHPNQHNLRLPPLLHPMVEKAHPAGWLASCSLIDSSALHTLDTAACLACLGLLLARRHLHQWALAHQRHLQQQQHE